MMIEVEDNEEVIQEDEIGLNLDGDLVEISLHAMTWTFHPKTPRLQANITCQLLSVLVNSGSTHNFIQQSIAIKIGCIQTPCSTFKVFVGSGKYLVCDEIFKEV